LIARKGRLVGIGIRPVEQAATTVNLFTDEQNPSDRAVSNTALRHGS
jgi:hypothetical protein